MNDDCRVLPSLSFAGTQLSVAMHRDTVSTRIGRKKRLVAIGIFVANCHAASQEESYRLQLRNDGLLKHLAGWRRCVEGVQYWAEPSSQSRSV